MLASAGHARPVSYVGGWTVIEESNRQATSLWLHYTVTPKWSVGWRSEWDRQFDFSFHGVQATHLFKRWFGEDHQGNLYGLAGVGVASATGANDASDRAAGFAGILADFETRRWFASYSARALEAAQTGSGFFQTARAGVAPYIGDTDDWHTWLMIEIDHRPKADTPVDITPLVRLFKGAALFEAGWSVRDEKALLNFTYRL